MSSMNIVEKRRPQDGQFSTVVDGKPIDVRVGSVATVFGEKIVMRILDKGRSDDRPQPARVPARDLPPLLERWSTPRSAW